MREQVPPLPPRPGLCSPCSPDGEEEAHSSKTTQWVGGGVRTELWAPELGRSPVCVCHRQNLDQELVPLAPPRCAASGRFFLLWEGWA